MVPIIHVYPTSNDGFLIAQYFMIDFGVPTQIMDLAALHFSNDDAVEHFKTNMEG